MTQPFDLALPRVAHVHRCAMRVLAMDDDIAQGHIMEYILENKTGCPLFLLNDVPMYARGYRAAMESEDNGES